MSEHSISTRIDNITLVDDEWAKTILPAPPSVKIELTSRCNYKCSFCATSQNLRTKGDMDFTQYTHLINDLVQAGVKEVGVFYLGESFLYPRLPEAIEYAKNAGIEYVFLTTNGSLCNGKKLQAVLHAGLDSLKFSFNYADEAQFKSIARVKGSYFQDSIKAVQTAHAIRKRHGYDCGLYASYIDYDGDQGKRMQYAINEIRPYVDEIYALPLYNQGGFVDTEVSGVGHSIPGNVGRAANPREPLPCWSGFKEGHVSYDLKLVFCCFSHDERFIMGDLTKEGFMGCWNSDMAQDLRAAHLAKDVTGTVCEACVIYE